MQPGEIEHPLGLIQEKAAMDLKAMLAGGKANLGHCPICASPTVFVELGDWLRDQYLCVLCNSVPRWRAVIEVLDSYFPNWRDLTIHESSPGGASSEKLARECPGYLASHFFPNLPAGSCRDGIRCEDLEAQSFEDERFDLVITQDVFEHLFDPERAFREIHRTLKPGGCHVFTVPWYYWQATRVRAVRENGKVRHLDTPDYHGNPIDPGGSLVTREWGHDLAEIVFRACGMATMVVRIRDRAKGIDGAMCEVFVSRKP